EKRNRVQIGGRIIGYRSETTNGYRLEIGYKLGTGYSSESYIYNVYLVLKIIIWKAQGVPQ
ncbi:MAG: hypothetical protein KZQ70_14445, partial [gamma proteobacterium symbiont of Lucinoma myriamae]|nr:hypothetical protein [gamma proteobacterium symbiont of Lucinoma myriamae]